MAMLSMFGKLHVDVRNIFALSLLRFYYFYTQAKISDRLHFYQISTFTTVVGEYWYTHFWCSYSWYYRMECNGNYFFCATMMIFAENRQSYGSNLQKSWYIRLDRACHLCFFIKTEKIWWNYATILPKRLWVILRILLRKLDLQGFECRLLIISACSTYSAMQSFLVTLFLKWKMLSIYKFFLIGILNSHQNVSTDACFISEGILNFDPIVYRL